MNRQKLVKGLTYFYLIPFGIMVVFNTVNSLLRTTYFDLYQYMETAKYKWDNPVFKILATPFLIIILAGAVRHKDAGKEKALRIALLFSGLLSLFTVLLFRCTVTCDSEIISNIAIEFLKGNYQAFEKGGYLFMYPFQLGVTALLEGIYWVFGIENFYAFQLLNIISILVIIRMLNLIIWELSENEKICQLGSYMSMGMLPLFLFSTFVYGDLIGWGFGVSGIYFILRYLKTDRLQHVIKASVLMAAGIVIKSNIDILVVAAVIAVMLHAIGKKNYRALIWGIVIVIVSQTGVTAVNYVYRQRVGLEKIPEGIPKIAWVAMGMQQGDEGGYACGWYNSYNWTVYLNNGFDREQTTQACQKNLKESVSKFMNERRYALDYFYKKFTSQWNAPTFQSMITNEWGSRYVENLSPLAEFFLYGRGRDILYGVMNIYHFFIFLCTGLSFWFSRKNWSLERAYFILNIFGGFLFHMIWEAQSRYVLEYFVLMLPLAAFGVSGLIEAIGQACKKGDIKQNRC